MRALFFLLIVSVVAVGTLFAACGGDDEPSQTQPEQQQTPQAARSDDAGSTQRPATTARTQSAQESAEQGETQATEQVEAQPEAGSELDDPLFAEALAAFEAWAAGLESFEMAVDVDINLGGLSSQLETMILVQVEPFMALTTIDASSLFGMVSALADDEEATLDEPLLMRVLISEDAAYLSMPQIGGWIDLSDQFEETLGSLTGLLGTNPEDLTDPNQFGQAFGCIETVGGSIAEGQHGGEPVWIVDCLIEVDLLNASAEGQLRSQGIDVTEAGIDTMRLRLTVSQTSGAPVLVETDARLRDAFALSDGLSDGSDDADGAGGDAPEFYVSTMASLLRWNEPVEFPTPEPLVDGSLLEDFEEPSAAASPGGFGSSDEPPELLTPEQLLELASIWVANVGELQIEFVAQAVIDGEARLASTIVRSSRVQGAFETTVNIDGESTFRLLWNRDGIWTSDIEEDGEPIWAPSNPALLGFAGMTVDDFLADPDRLTLDPLHALLNISWATRTIEGSGPPVYELVIESGPLSPEDERFEQVSEILKADTAELLAESVTVESIEHYSTIITMRGNDGQITGQVTTAEFETDAGWVELVASLNLISDGPIEFSRPAK